MAAPDNDDRALHTAHLFIAALMQKTGFTEIAVPEADIVATGTGMKEKNQGMFVTREGGGIKYEIVNLADFAGPDDIIH